MIANVPILFDDGVVRVVPLSGPLSYCGRVRLRDTYYTRCDADDLFGAGNALPKEDGTIVIIAEFEINETPILSLRQVCGRMK